MRIALFILSHLTVLLLLGSPLFGAEGKKYAVLVGVEDYQHKNLQTGLKYCVEDVTEMAEILKKDKYEVILLTDDTGKKERSLQPTRANIEKQIQKILSKFSKGDTIILAFAGHGVQFAGQKEAYFCPSDARPFVGKEKTMVSITHIYRELEESHSGVKLIFLDACRNDPDPTRGRSGIDSKSLPPPSGVGVLFSCSSRQRAFESDTLKHGVFFHYVLEGLKGEAKGRDGNVTFDGLASYVRTRVPGHVKNNFNGRKQYPNLKTDLEGVPPVLLSSGYYGGDSDYTLALKYYSGDGVQVDYIRAFELFRKAAGRGHTLGQTFIGNQYANGHGIPVDLEEAIRWFKKAMPSLKELAEKGDPIAQIQYAFMHEKGLGVGIDNEKASKWYLKAANQNIAIAQCQMGLVYAQGKCVKRDDTNALQWTLKAANKGYALAQTNAAILYYEGRGVEKNLAEAAKFLHKAVDQNEPTAIVYKGQMYHHGIGVQQNYQEAMKLYRKAAKQRVAVAYTNIGRLYHMGKGVPQNNKEALKWYRKAVEQNEPMAYNFLGVMYYSGHGVEQNYQEAMRLFRKSADQRILIAYLNIANLYYSGEGVVEDHAEASKWYRKGAELNEPSSQNNLALMYETGDGVRQNHAEAVKWYQKAANQGHSFGQYNLAKMYQNGTGVNQDTNQAIKWFRKAAANTNELAAKKAKIKLKILNVSP